MLCSSLIALAVSVNACATAPTPCASPRHCEPERECLANRCVPRGAPNVSTHSTRRLIHAGHVMVLRDGAALTNLPPAVTFGGPSARAETLLVTFPEDWSGFSVESAFLLLTPAPAAQPAGQDVPLEVSLVPAPGQGESAPAAARGGEPSSRAWARSAALGPLRVDVTEQVRALATGGSSRRAFRVRALEVTPVGASYMTGAAGELPRLDVYGASAAPGPAQVRSH